MQPQDQVGSAEYVGAVLGHYVLGNQKAKPGVNVFACRARSMSPTSFVVAAPVIGEVGQVVTASFGPFGKLTGRIENHVEDGFTIGIEVPPARRQELGQKISALKTRAWTGMAEQRGEPRYMPGEPRSVIVLADGTVLPCLVVDYSASGTAVSADLNPAIGTELVVGQVAGRVVRHFEVGFAVTFTERQDPDAIELLLEAPEEWLEATRVLKTVRVDTSDPTDDPEPTGYIANA